MNEKEIKEKNLNNVMGAIKELDSPYGMTAEEITRKLLIWPYFLKEVKENIQDLIESEVIFECTPPKTPKRYKIQC